MKKLGLLLILLLGCKPPQLSTDISDRNAYKLYESSYTDDEYKRITNTDSSFAFCIMNDQSELVSEPITFFVVNIKEKEKVLVSINEYHKVQWLDNENLLFTKYTGAPKSNKNLNKKPDSGISKYIFNVISKKIRPLVTEFDKSKP